MAKQLPEMKLFKTILVILLTVLSSTFLTAQNSEEDKSAVSFVKQHLGIDDPIKLLASEKYGEGDDEHVNVFIDYKLDSKFHRSVTVDYSIYDQSQYRDYYQFGIDRYKKVVSKDNEVLKELTGNWLNISRYQNKFYVFNSLCTNANMGFTITDSTFINYYMDGPAPEVIIDVQKKGDEVIISAGNSVIKMKLIDAEKQIYIIKENNYLRYIMPYKNIDKLPIIVEDCHETGAESDIEFDEIKY